MALNGLKLQIHVASLHQLLNLKHQRSTIDPVDDWPFRGEIKQSLSAGIRQFSRGLGAVVQVLGSQCD